MDNFLCVSVRSPGGSLYQRFEVASDVTIVELKKKFQEKTGVQQALLHFLHDFLLVRTHPAFWSQEAVKFFQNFNA